MVNMQHFEFGHLKDHNAMQISQSFHELANAVSLGLPTNEEKAICLRKILEAKDCAVRSYFEGPQAMATRSPEQVRDLPTQLADMQEQLNAANARAANLEAALQKGYMVVPEPGTPPQADGDE